MAKDSQFNLFDPQPPKKAGSFEKKTVKKTSLPKKILSSEAIAEKLHSISDQELTNMVERIQFLQKDLESQVSHIKDKIPSTYANIAKFLNDKENFPPEQWALIQENREELEKKLWTMVGKDPKKAKEKRQEEKSTKELRNKSLGARRNWIPIR